MIFGLTPYALVHVLISLVAIVSGLVVLFGMIESRRLDGLTLLFLVTTAATTITGFGFPIRGLTPALTLGMLSTIVLVAAFAARYAFHLRGASRWIYVVSATVALYFNVFVLVVQSFLKIAPLHVLAPNGSEPPFAIAQGVVLLAFIVAGVLAARCFRPTA